MSGEGARFDTADAAAPEVRIPEARIPEDPEPPEPPESPESPGEAAPDYDALQSLGDEIAVLAAHIHAATHRLLVLIARFDRLRGWEPAGFRSCAHWLSYRTGIGLGAAREKVRAARALEGLPETSAAMASRSLTNWGRQRYGATVPDPRRHAEGIALATSRRANDGGGSVPP